MSFLNKKTARRLQKIDHSVIMKQIPPEDTARNLACYNGETIVSTNSILNTGLALHVFTNPVRQINSGTMQLQFNR